MFALKNRHSEHFCFPSDLRKIKDASQKVLSTLDDLKLNKSDLFDIKLCFEEALINGIKHGNKGDIQLNIEAEVIKAEKYLEIIVRDQGSGFDFSHCVDPTKEENLIKTCGRGVFLIHKLMDKVRYEKKGSCVHMIKYLSKKEKSH
ncbi:MAG: ATP-binding protein [Candidatus Omnitrophota bacterium]